MLFWTKRVCVAVNVSEFVKALHWDLLQRLALGCVHLRDDEMMSQAATWNSPAMNSAWALMSLPPMFRTCPFLIIAITS